MTNIHLIRSVKGGSGKTTFALRTLLDLALQEEKKLLYLDTDVHASETAYMLYRSYSQYEKAELKSAGRVGFFSFCESYKPPKHFLNSYIKPYKGYSSKLEEIIHHATLYTARISGVQTQVSVPDNSNNAQKAFSIYKPTKRRNVDFIFTDPSKEGRAVFGSLFQSAGRSAIGVGAYLAKIKELLKYIVKAGYNDVVIDMPPGSDTFSTSLADEIVEFVTKQNKNCSLNVYYVTSDDRYHMRSAAEAAIEYLHLIRNSSPVKIFYVYNQGREKETSQDDYNSMSEIITGVSIAVNRPYSIIPNVEYDLKRLNYKTFKRDSIYYSNVRDTELVFFTDSSNLVKELS